MWPVEHMSDEEKKGGKAADVEDILRTYLNEISEIPLLTKEQEMELGKRAREGDQKAIDELVRSNLRFVVTIAKKYKNSGVPLPDLINEGNIGLIEAAKKFDPDKANRFITYAKWWIQQAIRSGLASQAGIVRLPAKQRSRLWTIKSTYEELRAELDRPPTAREIADKVGISEEEIETLMRASTDAISIESSKDQGSDILEASVDEGEPYGESRIEKALIVQSYMDRLQEIMEELTPQEKKVIALRFGLDDGIRRSLDSIGQQMGVSRERIRQIEEAAKRKIRAFAKSRKLAVVLN